MKNNGKVADLFAAVLELETGERAVFLEQACAGDVTLRVEVEELLNGLRNAEHESFMSAPAIEIEAEHIAREVNEECDSRIGQTFGRYRILRKIGSGGMGAIYLATRSDDEFHKKVAVKVIKRGMDTDAILRRFRNERQIHANLEHPNIARLLDGGTTADGLPYLVMEYVEGVSINEFCEQHKLSTSERVNLFRIVCSAVAFAHRNLVVHRDLKPSNILVTPEGEPKLLDFGIAKLLGENEPDFATQTNLRVLTPAYASPEQTAGATITTATDIYSLGIILYELLTGERPNWSKSESSKVKSKELNPENQKLKIRNNKLKGELKIIVAQATRIEPERRYSSVEKFSDDLRRYLDGLPVSARADTFVYRSGKFIKRNKFLVSAVAAVCLLLIAGVAAIIWQARIAQTERAKAERRAENLRKLSNSFAIELHGAIVNLPGSLPARKLLLSRAVEQLDALAAESDGNVALQDELAEGYYRLGEMPAISIADAQTNYQKAIAIYQKILITEPENLKFRRQLAKGFELLGNLEEVRGSVSGAFAFHKQASEILESVASDDSSLETRLDLLNSYEETAANLYFMGEARKSLVQSQKAMVLSEELVRLDPNNIEYRQAVYDSRGGVVRCLQYLGDYKSAIDELLAIINDYKSQAKESPNDVRLQYALWAYHRRLGVLYEHSGDKIKALDNLQTALGIMENLYHSSPDDTGYQRNTAFSNLSIGQALTRQNQPVKALPYLRRALELSDKLIAADPERGETIKDLGSIHGSLGTVLLMLGNRAQALEHFRQSNAFFEKSLTIDGQNAFLLRDYAESEAQFAKALEKNGSPSEIEQAEEFYRRSLKIWQDLQAKNILSAFDSARPAEIAQHIQSERPSKD